MIKDQILANLPISTELGFFKKTVETLKQQYLQIWQETSASLPQFYQNYCPKEQQELENEMSNYLHEMLLKIEQTNPDERENELDSIFLKSSYIKKFATFSDDSLDESYLDGFKHSTKIFLEKSKRFDPTLKAENIYQALRNVWIMNSLQIYLNQPVNCSDSIFAYSMLYPYTDNIMDDISSAIELKLSMNQNLKEWLEGNDKPYQNEIERKIYALVKLIEREFPRDKFHYVFPGILTIYNAQIKSLFQQSQHHTTTEKEIFDITFEKGGTSVLADGYLITGALHTFQENFCFGYGVLLQLADDIQDVIKDKNNNHQTLFSQVAGNQSLDAAANKLFNFITTVIEYHLSNVVFKKLKELILKNCYLLVIEAIGENIDLYTRSYIKEIEIHFPFRFCYLNHLKEKLKKYC